MTTDDDDMGYDDLDDDCDCADADYDLLAGRRYCHRCGNAWSMTTAELQAALQADVEYQEGLAEQFSCEPTDRRET